MDFAKVTTNGQVTIPIEFRRALNIRPGNKVLFFRRQNGDVVINNGSISPLAEAQAAFSGAATDLGYKDEASVLKDIMKSRYAGAAK